jgi:hypothetical protein
VLTYLRRAAGAVRTILRNPIGFVGNLVRAALLGLRQFATNFLTHLRASLIGWLTGAMSGANVYVPQAFTLQEILKFALSVLGLTWQNIRQKLVRAVGETAVAALETGFDIVVTLVTQGPAAAWEKILETLGNLREMVIEQVMSFVRDNIVQAAITRLVTSLNPAGAFIQAVIAIYNTIMFFVERLRQIAQVAAAFIDALSAIASGVLAAAANRVEQTMAGMLTLVISFLARIAGLGRVSDAVTGVINRVRQPIDRALDRVVEWIVATARRLGRLVASTARSAVRAVTDWWRTRMPLRGRDRSSHSLYFEGGGASAEVTVATTPLPVREFLRRIESDVRTNTDPEVPASHREAQSLLQEVQRLVARVGRAGGSPDLRDVDALNEALIALSRPLTVLVALLPSGAPAGSLPVSVGQLIRVERAGLVAVVVEIAAPMIRYRFVRPGRRTVEREGRDIGSFIRDWGREFRLHEDDPRELYMGSTPSRDSGVGRLVKQRMQGEGTYTPVGGGQVRPRRLTNSPWIPIAECDMGHLVDAVVWWNSNGRLTGAQSSTVLAFMDDHRNYELEASADNRRRGAALAARRIRYEAPTV